MRHTMTNLTRIPRIEGVAWQNRSNTRQICRIYIPSEGLF